MLQNFLNFALENKRLAIVVASALVFVAAQMFAATHAAEFGEESHEHNGTVCVVSVISKGGEKFLTAATVAFVAVIITWRAGGAAAQTELSRLAVRAARPRGPPNP